MEISALDPLDARSTIPIHTFRMQRKLLAEKAKVRLPEGGPTPIIHRVAEVLPAKNAEIDEKNAILQGLQSELQEVLLEIRRLREEVKRLGETNADSSRVLTETNADLHKQLRAMTDANALLEKQLRAMRKPNSAAFEEFAISIDASIRRPRKPHRAAARLGGQRVNLEAEDLPSGVETLNMARWNGDSLRSGLDAFKQSGAQRSAKEEMLASEIDTLEKMNAELTSSLNTSR